LLKARVEAALHDAADDGGADALAAQLFAMLADSTPAEDAQLPRTGLDRERERQLSSAFIRMPEGTYGTRCSTLIITERAAKHLVTHVFERSFNGDPGLAQLRRATLKDWPPKYQPDQGTEARAPAEAGAAGWGAVGESDLAEVALEAPKKRRVRSLIRPLR
jgi:hypothetical protein